MCSNLTITVTLRLLVSNSGFHLSSLTTHIQSREVCPKGENKKKRDKTTTRVSHLILLLQNRDVHTCCHTNTNRRSWLTFIKPVIRLMFVSFLQTDLWVAKNSSAPETVVTICEKNCFLVSSYVLLFVLNGWFCVYLRKSPTNFVTLISLKLWYNLSEIKAHFFFLCTVLVSFFKFFNSLN